MKFNCFFGMVCIKGKTYFHGFV